jgi:hypothetical protein
LAIYIASKKKKGAGDLMDLSMTRQQDRGFLTWTDQKQQMVPEEISK